MGDDTTTIDHVGPMSKGELSDRLASFSELCDPLLRLQPLFSFQSKWEPKARIVLACLCVSCSLQGVSDKFFSGEQITSSSVLVRSFWLHLIKLHMCDALTLTATLRLQLFV